MGPAPPVTSTGQAGSGAATQKRPGAHLADRPPKRRSTRACLSCRNRKVRCDVNIGGVPCTNCKLDDVQCILKQSSRGKRRDTTTSQHAASTASPRSTTAPTAHQQATPPFTESATASYLVSLTFEDERMQSPESQHLEQDSQDETEDGPHDIRAPRIPAEPENRYAEQPAQMNAPLSPQSNPMPPQLGFPEPPPSSRVSGEQPQVDAPMPLPPYIKRLPRHIRERDVQYLVEKDAFTIPDDDFRDELLRTYVKIVHCFMPALDIDALLVPVIKSDGQNPISLLLFQAVMFASVIFVDSEMLRSRGYVSRKAARKVFFNRVRLLYGLDCESDRLALVQALLLMTYWYDSPDDEKDTWYWMGITLSLTQVLGLHRDPETLNLDLRQKRLRRRIWWSVYIRDRLLALGIRRPARIRKEDFQVSMLELDDFDLVQPAPEHIAFVGACGYTTVEADRRRAMCQICVELAKLCVCIGEILHTQYSVVSNQPFNYEPYKHVAVLPMNSEQQMLELARCDNMLEEWNRNQKATCRYAPPSPASTAGETGFEGGEDWAEKITWLHQALLRMVHLTAVGALHRPRALTSSASPSAAGSGSLDMAAAKKASMQKVKDAAVMMTKLTFDLQSENHLRYLSTSSVPAFLSATLIHLLDVRDKDEEVRNLAIGRFYQCFHALYELRDMYASADYAIRFLKTVLKRMDANIPMLRTLRMFANTMVDQSRQSIQLDTHGAYEWENYNIPFDGPRQGTPAIANHYHVPPPQMLPVSSVGEMHEVSHRDPEFLLATLGTTPSVNMGPPIGTMSTLQPFPDQYLVGTPHMEIWNGVDDLLPALIQFDADPATTLANQEIRMPGTPWRPYV